MLKLFLLLVSFAAYGQATINAPAVALDATGTTAVLAWMSGQTTGIQTALAAPVAPGDTQITVASGQGLNNAVLSIGAEHVQVTARSGNTLTVTRGTNGTTPGTHAAGATVAEMKYKTLNALGRQMILDSLRQIVRQQRQASITAAQAAVDAEAAAAVQ